MGIRVVFSLTGVSLVRKLPCHPRRRSANHSTLGPWAWYLVQQYGIFVTMAPSILPIHIKTEFRDLVAWRSRWRDYGDPVAPFVSTRTPNLTGIPLPQKRRRRSRRQH